MKLFRNLPLLWKLVAITFFPVVSLIFITRIIILSNYAIVNENEKITQLLELSVYANALVHELQKERGASAGYFGSQGTLFGNELKAQHVSTNFALETLQTAFEEKQTENLSKEFLDHIDSALLMLDNLEGHRDDIFKFNIPTNDAISYYTNINSAFLTTTGLLHKYSSSTEFSGMIGSYSNFLNSKERAGIERAVLANTFSLDYFGEGMYDKFMSLVTIQDTYLDVFFSMASPENLEFYNNTMQGQYISETERLRSIAMERFMTGGFNVESTHWFAMQTGKINLLKTTEDYLADNLLEFSSQLEKAAWNELKYSLGISIAALVLSLAVGLFVKGMISRPLKLAVNISNAIANGKMDNSFPILSNDEIGSLLISLHKMQSNISEMFSTQQKQANENSRILQALDNATANIMLIDSQNSIIYMNKTIETLFKNHEKDIQKDLGTFNVSQLIGNNINVLLGSQANKDQLLQNMLQETPIELSIGDCFFNILTNNVTDQNGSPQGMLVEWDDLTNQKNAEKQLHNILLDAAAGKLDVRLNKDEFEGFMKIMADGINQMLDAIVTPLHLAADYMARISKGDIPDLIQNEYHGDFNLITNNLNICIKAINLLLEDSHRLSVSAIEGNLHDRADTSLHEGDFQKIVIGINNTLDSIVTPITDCKNVMRHIKNGELTKRMQSDYAGEFGVLSESVNASIDNLFNMVKEISQSADNISTSASEIALGNSDLNQRTEEQAASLEETASNVEQLTNTVRTNAENSHDVDLLAKEARLKAVEGGETVDKAIIAMHDISSSSDRIADIISVIDEISFQTKLLSLNASVEAARAGEQGKGFAVVAAEVGNLASRSSKAAKEIKDIIIESASKVEEGSKLVNASGITLGEIVTSVSKVSDLVSEIAEVSEDQSSNIRQVYSAVTQIDEMTQQNSALVEEASAASTSMNNQAHKLKELMASFILDEKAPPSNIIYIKEAG